jgi:hypothetical protein
MASARHVALRPTFAALTPTSVALSRSGMVCRDNGACPATNNRDSVRTLTWEQSPVAWFLAQASGLGTDPSFLRAGEDAAL